MPGRRVIRPARTRIPRRSLRGRGRTAREGKTGLLRPSIGYYVVTSYDAVEAVFRDPAAYSAAVTQAPLAPIVPEAQQILSAAGHKPQHSMVSLDEPEHARLRKPAARAFSMKRVTAMIPRHRGHHRPAARRRRRRGGVRLGRRAGVSAPPARSTPVLPSSRSWSRHRGQLHCASRGVTVHGDGRCYGGDAWCAHLGPEGRGLASGASGTLMGSRKRPRQGPRRRGITAGTPLRS
jgi:hypothetical protein